MRYPSDLGGRYTPMYFLAALGAGGLAVSFFMYLMWLTPHPASPIPTFGSLSSTWAEGTPVMRGLIGLSAAGIALFSVLHLRLLAWNLRQCTRWLATPAAEALRSGNAETQLMALPLALAMAVNVGFIFGAVFVPGLWEQRELLFPLAVLAFAAIGILAMRMFLAFLGRNLAFGGFDCAKNNSLGQMLSVFTFAMVGVGLSAAAAMSQVKWIVAAAFAGAMFFIVAAGILGVVFLVLGFRAMMEHAAAEETTPTLWMLIPILTVFGIAVFRLKMSLAHTFNSPVTTGEIFALLLGIVAAQLLFGLIGWAVMSRVGYFAKYVSGGTRSPGSFALVCPGVGLFVSGQFLVHAALVRLGLIELYSIAHGLVLLPLLALQVATIALFFKLSKKLMSAAPEAPPRAAPATLETAA
ncbi:MAG TPA: hypothetical protein PK264_02690 [Hyphomicrobiaceae bacterium]|nr:hypothetical protein [Hyphomicrobiaceae bacterium]